MKRMLWVPALAVTVAILAGCAPATVVQSNRATDYAAKPGRMFVIGGAGLGWGPGFTGAFRDKLREIGAQCGSTVAFEEVTGLELDQTEPARHAAAFHPDTLMTIQQGGGVVNAVGDRLSIRYNMVLRDIHERRVVWRGNFGFARGGTMIPIEERGAVFAIELTNSLKQDGMLRGCSPIALGSGGRLPEGGSTAKPAPAATPAATGTPAATPAAAPATSPAAMAAPRLPGAVPPTAGRGVNMADLDGLLPAK